MLESDNPEYFNTRADQLVAVLQMVSDARAREVLQTLIAELRGRADFLEKLRRT